MFHVPSSMFQENEKGAIALLLTVIVLSVIFVIAAGMAVIRIIELQLALDVSDSVEAYQAADSGVECALNEIDDDSDITSANLISNCNGVVIGDESYTLEIISRDASNDVEKIKSIGESAKIKRAVEVCIKNC